MYTLVAPSLPQSCLDDRLGRLRVQAGRLGLKQDLWSHLPPEEEARKLTEFTTALNDQLDKSGLGMDEYKRIVSGRIGPGILRYQVG